MIQAAEQRPHDRFPAPDDVVGQLRHPGQRRRHRRPHEELTNGLDLKWHSDVSDAALSGYPMLSSSHFWLQPVFHAATRGRALPPFYFFVPESGTSKGPLSSPVIRIVFGSEDSGARGVVVFGAGVALACACDSRMIFSISLRSNESASLTRDFSVVI